MHHPIRTATAGALAWLLTAAALAPVAQAQPRGSSTTVRVSVVSGAIQVSPDEATLPTGVLTVRWEMATAGWTFAANSIDFGDAASHFVCKVGGGGTSISCNRSVHAPKGPLPYQIRLLQNGQLLKPPQPEVYISLD